MSLELFQESFRSEFTKYTYKYYLKKYGLDKLSITDPRLVETEIITFILEMKKKRKSSAAIGNYVKAVISYYKINDVVLNTKKYLDSCLKEGESKRTGLIHILKFQKC